MNAVILVCSSLKSHIDAAQAKMKTNYPVVTVDRKYHEDPKKMRKEIIRAIENISANIDTVLVAMGFCGGSWEAVPLQKRIVIPRVDDCITLLLHTDETWHPNLKKTGHFYLQDDDISVYSLAAMKRNLCEKYGEQNGNIIFDEWFSAYTDIDIIDTGEYDCYSESYVAGAQKDAGLIQGRLNYVEGSNLLLEKLVSRNWDQQFLVVNPGQVLSVWDFLPVRRPF